MGPYHLLCIHTTSHTQHLPNHGLASITSERSTQPYTNSSVDDNSYFDQGEIQERLRCNFTPRKFGTESVLIKSAWPYPPSIRKKDKQKTPPFQCGSLHPTQKQGWMSTCCDSEKCFEWVFFVFSITLGFDRFPPDSIRTWPVYLIDDAWNLHTHPSMQLPSGQLIMAQGRHWGRQSWTWASIAE